MMSQFQERLGPNRLANFKNRGKSCDEMRRRRSTVTIELRKASRDEQIFKKRSITLNDQKTIIENSIPPSLTKLTLEEIMTGIKSSDENVLFNAVQVARRILSSDKNPPVDVMIRAGIVSHCVDLLSDNYSTRVQFEACWVLTNVASGTAYETNVIIEAGAIPKLIRLLESPNAQVAEQAAWALGNIAGDGPTPRDKVIEAGIFPPILKLAESPNVTISMLRNTVWTISNLCRNKNPPPSFAAVKVCLPTLHKMLYSNDNDVLADTCWTLSYLTDGPNSQIQAVIDANVVPRLVELLSAPSTVLTPALRAVGNIVTGNEEQTDTVVKAGALPKLGELLNNKKLNIVKEATWSISNIAAGTSSQIQAIIDADILPTLVTILKSGDFKSQKEAAWAVTNFTSGATIPQLSQLIKCGVLPPYCNMLDSKDNRIVLAVLDGISNFLCNAEVIGQMERVAIMIEECGGLDKLQALQSHEMQQIYQKAYVILDMYFNGETSEIGPEEVNGQFKFNPEEPSQKFSF